MELEFHQLDLRYETLRRRSPEREKRLIASLAHCGQQMPIGVVRDEHGGYVVIDGYKRIRALKRLKADTVAALTWDLGEIEALLLAGLMRTADGDDAFEQGWLLRELRGRFGLSQDELALRFDKSKSWVCRRLSLVEQLPDEIQDRVRRGELVPHAAMKYLVPLARANRSACIKLVTALGGKKPSSREMGAIYNAWSRGDAQVRERLIADPWLFLNARAAQTNEAADEPAARQILRALDTCAAVCRRLSGQLRQGLARELQAAEKKQVRLCLAQARADATATFQLIDTEVPDAQPESTLGHPRAAQAG